jgi:hypothetical protein
MSEGGNYEDRQKKWICGNGEMRVPGIERYTQGEDDVQAVYVVHEVRKCTPWCTACKSPQHAPKKIPTQQNRERYEKEHTPSTLPSPPRAAPSRPPRPPLLAHSAPAPLPCGGSRTRWLRPACRVSISNFSSFHSDRQDMERMGERQHDTPQRTLVNSSPAPLIAASLFCAASLVRCATYFSYSARARSSAAASFAAALASAYKGRVRGCECRMCRRGGTEREGEK